MRKIVLSVVGVLVFATVAGAYECSEGFESGGVPEAIRALQVSCTHEAETTRDVCRAIGEQCASGCTASCTGAVEDILKAVNEALATIECSGVDFPQYQQCRISKAGKIRCKRRIFLPASSARGAFLVGDSLVPGTSPRYPK